MQVQTGFEKIRTEIAKKYQPKKTDGLKITGLFHDLERKMAPCVPSEVIRLKEDLERANVSTLEAIRIAQDTFDYTGMPEHIQYVRAGAHARRISSCGTYLEFSHGGEGRKLDFADFCHDRFCPCCNWRRSLKVYGQIQAVLGHLAPEQYTYLFLTLTQKNCGASDPAELKQECDRLYEGWRWLYRNGWMFRDGIVQGTIRSFEITYNQDSNTFHPHFHVILAMPKDYFDARQDYYTTSMDWAEEWACALDLNYLPNVDIRRLRPDDDEGQGVSYAKAVAEVSKYATKITDVLRYHRSRGVSILESLTYALHGRRLLGLTGCFRKAFQALNLEDPESVNADLVNVDNDDLSAEHKIDFSVWKWDWRARCYHPSEDSAKDVQARLVDSLFHGFQTPGGRRPLGEEARPKFERKLALVKQMSDKKVHLNKGGQGNEAGNQEHTDFRGYAGTDREAGWTDIHGKVGEPGDTLRVGIGEKGRTVSGYPAANRPGVPASAGTGTSHGAAVFAGRRPS